MEPKSDGKEAELNLLRFVHLRGLITSLLSVRAQVTLMCNVILFCKAVIVSSVNFNNSQLLREKWRFRILPVNCLFAV